MEEQSLYETILNEIISKKILSKDYLNKKLKKKCYHLKQEICTAFCIEFLNDDVYPKIDKILNKYNIENEQEFLNRLDEELGITEIYKKIENMDLYNLLKFE